MVPSEASPAVRFMRRRWRSGARGSLRSLLAARSARRQSFALPSPRSLRSRGHRSHIRRPPDGRPPAARSSGGARLLTAPAGRRSLVSRRSLGRALRPACRRSHWSLLPRLACRRSLRSLLPLARSEASLRSASRPPESKPFSARPATADSCRRERINRERTAGPGRRHSGSGLGSTTTTSGVSSPSGRP